MRGRESTSRLFRFDVELAHPSGSLSAESVVGSTAVLHLSRAAGVRGVHGIVREFEHRGTFEGAFHSTAKQLTLYHAVIAPSVWLLGQRRDCRIFQKHTSREIIEQVLTAAGIAGSGYRFDLEDARPRREYCVQYRETDWAFVSRLLEEDGVTSWFEHGESHDVLVMSDKTNVAQPIAGGSTLPFREGRGQVEVAEVIHAFEVRRRVRSGCFTLADYNFLKPKRNLVASKDGEHDAALEVYDHPGGHDERGEGVHLAELLLDASDSRRQSARGQSSCARLQPGQTFTLTEHPRREDNQSWRITAVMHRSDQRELLGLSATGTVVGYANEFECVSEKVRYRPLRRHAKPVIPGVQTAIVVGPAGEEVWTDAHGRVKLQFHWDRAGRRDANSSCWVRVSQVWAGPGYGAMHVPRIGNEVIVSFVEGDPDRPLVTGRLYHGENQPPRALPEHKAWSTVKTRSLPGGNGHNEFSLVDVAGQELIRLHGHRDMLVEIGNDVRRTVVRDVVEDVGRHRTETVHANETVTVDGDRSLTVKGKDEETVQGDRKVAVQGKHEETVQGDRSMTVTGAIKIRAEQKIEIACGGGKITLDPAGRITIDGVMVEIVGSGIVKVNGTLVQINC
jgi:type VI secretion system secreted protein VgrG